MSLTTTIKDEALRIGFDAVGISRLPVSNLPSQNFHDRPAPLSPSIIDTLCLRLRQWLQQGFHATMEWMSRFPQKRSDPTRVLPGCQSIISVAINYYTDELADERPGHGRIARYAWGKDYHNLFKQRLKKLEAIILNLAPEAKTKWYADTGPIMEKAWAQEAGLGWIGKHSNLVSSEYGSWLLLGEILTTLELESDAPGADLCGSCTLCINACPTGAIVEPYIVNAEKCLSYVTIEHRGSEETISPEIKGKIGNRIFGCDDCLDVCPFNHHSIPTKEPTFSSSNITIAPKLSELQTMPPELFAAMFQKSPIRRAKHDGFMRNIRMAQEQSGSISTRSP